MNKDRQVKKIVEAIITMPEQCVRLWGKKGIALNLLLHIFPAL